MTNNLCRKRQAPRKAYKAPKNRNTYSVLCGSKSAFWSVK